jgi:hypothetical protein
MHLISIMRKKPITLAKPRGGAILMARFLGIRVYPKDRFKFPAKCFYTEKAPWM